jgi:Excalibur calcium-binding domain
MSRWLRDVRGGLGLMVLGAGLGATAFILFDAVQPPEQPPTIEGLSLRATYYNSCREAFQDGRINIRTGEPGYRPELDADGDGLACEPFLRKRR